MSTETAVVKEITLAAEKRTKTGTSESRRLRREGIVPGNIYGHKQEPIAITVSGKVLEKLIYSGSHLIDLELNGETNKALFREVQWNTFSTHVIHFDLLWVDQQEEVHVELPIELHGNAPGITAGGVLDQPMRSVGMTLKVIDMIDSVVVNINHLEIGQAVLVKELELPASAKPDAGDETVVVQVIEATEDPDELEEDSLAAPSQPEVIGQKKEDEE